MLIFDSVVIRHSRIIINPITIQKSGAVDDCAFCSRACLKSSNSFNPVHKTLLLPLVVAIAVCLAKPRSSAKISSALAESVGGSAPKVLHSSSAMAPA